MDSKKLYPLAALGYEFSIRVCNFSKKLEIEFQNSFFLSRGSLQNGVK